MLGIINKLLHNHVEHVIKSVTIIKIYKLTYALSWWLMKRFNRYILRSSCYIMSKSCRSTEHDIGKSYRYLCKTLMTTADQQHRQVFVTSVFYLCFIFTVYSLNTSLRDGKCVSAIISMKAFSAELSVSLSFSIFV